jgi:sugar fermentation stimulation protein A
VGGRLVRRYQRFLAEVELPTGERLTVHCPDPGSMRGLVRPGAAVRCSVHDDPRRKLRHTLELIRVGHHWVGVYPARANALIALALAKGALPEFAPYTRVEREVGAGGGTRLDFRLSGGWGSRGRAETCWLEVKSVTLAAKGRGRFPDSVTERGRRHVETLQRLCQRGERAALLFLTQRADCGCVEPADDIDPAYGAALRQAAAVGVEVFARRARVSPQAIRLAGPLPVWL